MNLNRPIGEGVCLRSMMNRNRHMRVRVQDKIYYAEPESPHERACLRSMMGIAKL